MSKFRTIPTTSNPFVVKINNTVYSYRAGETVEVPDEVASLIDNINALKPQQAKPDGVAGQVWVKDENGNGKWEDVVNALPSGGSFGKVLTVMNNGTIGWDYIRPANIAPDATGRPIGRWVKVTEGNKDSNNNAGAFSITDVLPTGSRVKNKVLVVDTAANTNSNAWKAITDVMPIAGNVEDATSASDVVTQFNALLAALRTVGYLGEERLVTSGDDEGGEVIPDPDEGGGEE